MSYRGKPRNIIVLLFCIEIDNPLTAVLFEICSSLNDNFVATPVLHLAFYSVCRFHINMFKVDTEMLSFLMMSFCNKNFK